MKRDCSKIERAINGGMALTPNDIGCRVNDNGVLEMYVKVWETVEHLASLKRWVSEDTEGVFVIRELLRIYEQLEEKPENAEKRLGVLRLLWEVVKR